MKPKTSSGVDEISAKLLKHCCNSITPALVSVINKSFTQGQFPSALKLAKIYPKYKTGSKTEASNYRPISLIPTFSKVIERVALNRLMDHCHKHQILTEGQHGFIKGRSTTTAIVALIEHIVDNLENGRLVTSILLDLSKAFDCLGHDLILHKLQKIGIKGTAKDWFQSYLEGRRQIVEITHNEKGTIRSQPLPTTRGVPQGSVLGPALFILFTNDLPNYIGKACLTLMFADDTTLVASGSCSDDLAISSYTALSMAYQYCSTNDLAVNQEKTKQLAFGRRKEMVSALPEVEVEDEAKFLGVTIDNNLSWTQHVDVLANKLSTSIYVVKRVKCISDLNTAKMAYYAVFESNLRYGLVAWGGTTAGNLQRILKLQKKAIRALSGLSMTDSCREAYISLKILTVISLYIKEVVLYAEKEAHPRSADLHSHNTRHASLYILPSHHLTLYEKKPSYMGRRLYNLLPEDIRRCTGKKLKSELTKWLQKKPFYTLDEFLQWRNPSYTF